METFTITVERNEEQAQLFRDLAAFYKMSVPEFLKFALMRGVAYSVDQMEATIKGDPSGIVDDGIPF
jgi:hypothetical protein